MEKYELTDVADTAENPYPLRFMNPNFKNLFRDLVVRRTELENHYKGREEAFSGDSAHEWQRELNRRWARWATAEKAVRSSLREAVDGEDFADGEEDETTRASLPVAA